MMAIFSRRNALKKRGKRKRLFLGGVGLALLLFAGFFFRGGKWFFFALSLLGALANIAFSMGLDLDFGINFDEIGGVTLFGILTFLFAVAAELLPAKK